MLGTLYVCEHQCVAPILSDRWTSDTGSVGCPRELAVCGEGNWERHACKTKWSESSPRRPWYETLTGPACKEGMDSDAGVNRGA